MAREATVVVRMDSEVKERFQNHAAELGITMSALAAFIIGSWMKQQENVVKPMNEMVISGMMDMFKAEMKAQYEEAFEGQEEALSEIQTILEKSVKKVPKK